jgi:type II secretion system protein G
MIKKFKKGFTLIELLVVLAIIGILAVVVLNQSTLARSKARDTVRKQNLDQLLKATNLYFSQTGSLPEGTSGLCHSVSNATYVAAYTTALAPYIKSIPNDPTKYGQVGDYVYNNISDNLGRFRLCANMENASNAVNGFDYSASVCPGGNVTYNYCVSQ